MKYFKKSDFKIGMRVVTADDEEWVVMPNVQDGGFEDGGLCLVKFGECGWNDLSDYDDTLNIRFSDGSPMKRFAINKIYDTKYNSCVLSSLYEVDEWNQPMFNLVWERPKQMTQEEIEKVLGYEIEIVK